VIRRTELPWNAALCFSAVLFAAAPLWAVAAADDYLVAVQDATMDFTYDDLLANDDTADPSPAVSIGDRPVHGDLVCDGSGCTYLPDGGFTGFDAFTYTVVDGKNGADSAAARIQVNPLVIPLAGDWNGDGVTDLGWFHGTQLDAFFFDFDLLAEGYPGTFFGCGHLPALGDVEGWTPIAGDWNGDGQDEIGFFDTATREYVLLVRDPPTGEWVEWRRFFHPVAGQGGAPVAGDWDGDGSDEVGLYLDDEKRFLLLSFDGEEVVVSHDFTFDGLLADSWAPVAGQWGGDGDGIDTLGLWNPGTRDLVIRSENTSGPAQDWPLATGDEDPAGPLPFAGKWGSWVSVGFYDPDGAGPGAALFVLYPWSYPPAPHVGGEPILLPPPEDPLLVLCTE
jgi:Bacterial Ig domain